MPYPPRTMAARPYLFRDTEQRDTAIITLLESCGLYGMWQTGGPTELGYERLGTHISKEPYLSLIRGAWDIYRAAGGSPLQQYYDVPVKYLIRMPPDALVTFASLMAAIGGGHDDIDDWILSFSEHEQAG